MLKQYFGILALSLLLSFGISIGFQILIPGIIGFIAGMVVLIGIFMALPLIIRNKRIRQKFNFGDFYDKQQQRFACTVCYNEHSRPICPKCGSRARRPVY